MSRSFARYCPSSTCPSSSEPVQFIEAGSVGEDRSRETLRPFFEQLGERAKSIEVGAMDQNSAFDLEVKLHCPQAEVVYDFFHVVAKHGREVIDWARVDQANALREDKPARRAVKRGRWLLLRNRCNLSDKQEAKLGELMEANQPLATVYVLKEQLKELCGDAAARGKPSSCGGNGGAAAWSRG